MPHEEAKIKLFTIQEANALLPQVHSALKTLRELRAFILRTQAQIEIEEMTGADSNGRLTETAQSTIEKCMVKFQNQTSQFEENLGILLGLGAHLKDLDLGLVDFYTRRDGEIVFLCWKEGEAQIRHWHTPREGYKNRKPL
jgi:hypothetical protein